MKVTGFNHLSIGTRNLAETVKFYETVLGMQTIPSHNFGFKTKASLYLDRPHLKPARRAR
jgi:catechol 2,3-dioxygenase-like lactoylglutathione lyase family enzyme